MVCLASAQCYQLRITLAQSIGVMACVLLALSLSLIGGATAATLDDLDWLVGQWRSEFDGKVRCREGNAAKALLQVRWPTIPTMTYGEVVTVAKAPRAVGGSQLYNWTATSWAHSTKDHLHDEWGYIGIGNNGKAVLMTSGNNGKTKSSYISHSSHE